jgi:hypothetical protein
MTSNTIAFMKGDQPVLVFYDFKGDVMWSAATQGGTSLSMDDMKVSQFAITLRRSNRLPAKCDRLPETAWFPKQEFSGCGC